MSRPGPSRRRRRLGVRHLAVASVLALMGAAGVFVSVNADASAHESVPPVEERAEATASPSPSTSLPSVTSGTDNRAADGAAEESAEHDEREEQPEQPEQDKQGGEAEQDEQESPDEANGPAAEDYVDIREVAPAPPDPRVRPGASTGSFTSRCGRNEEGHNNSDNFIVAPGVAHGAEHLHDYVGNRSTDAFSTDDSLRAAGTTCARDDRSTYFWPVIRTDGEAVRPRSVSLTFRGNPVDQVSAMPEALRAITGDAKALTNGTANARAQWSCTGFEDRRTADKYPLCPRGSQVVRLLDLPSCWDGENTDSADHRSHIVFPDRASGRCPEGTEAVPQLRMRLTYAVPARPLAFTVDSFPDQLNKPVTDHADFANFMPRALMDRAVRCINEGRRCG